MWHWSSRKHSPKDGERGQLLKVKWEVKAEAGLEESSDGLFRMKGEKKAALSTKYSSVLFEEKGAGQILLFNNDQLRNRMNPKHAFTLTDRQRRAIMKQDFYLPPGSTLPTL